MKITYNITRLDLFFAQIPILLRSRLVVLWNVIAALGIATVLFVGLLRDDEHTFVVVSLVSVVIFFLLLLFFVFFQLIFSLLYAFTTRKQGVIGEHTLEIKQEGLLEKTAFNESLNKWSGLQKIWQSRKYIGIHITDFLVHVVPIASVKEKDLLFDFTSEVSNRIKNANDTMHRMATRVTPPA